MPTTTASSTTPNPRAGGFRVYIDSNGDGIFESTEPSIVTGANGTFSFTNVGPAVIGGVANPVTFNGTYVVREAPRPGWIQTTAPLAAITLDSGQAVANELIGDIRTSSIAGSVIVDANGDGILQASETGLSGVTVTLTGPGGPVIAVTAADGSYSFPNLSPGTYTVTETAPAGYTQTTTNPSPVTVGAIDHIAGVNFGVFQSVTLSGIAFNDANDNGTMDAGETGVGGFTIDLVNATTSAVIGTTTSSASGAFSFTNVGPLPGGTNYTIVEEPKTGFVQTTTPPAAFAPSSGTDQTNFQFGTFRLYSVSGTAYIDLNDNNVQDAGEVGAAGFVIQLYDSSNVLVGTATSAADGSYTISGVGPETYTLIESPRLGFKTSEVRHRLYPRRHDRFRSHRQGFWQRQRRVDYRHGLRRCQRQRPAGSGRHRRGRLHHPTVGPGRHADLRHLAGW